MEIYFVLRIYSIHKWFVVHSQIKLINMLNSAMFIQKYTSYINKHNEMYH